MREDVLGIWFLNLGFISKYENIEYFFAYTYLNLNIDQLKSQMVQVSNLLIHLLLR